MIRVLQVIGSLNAGGSQAMIMNLYRHIDRSKIQFDFVIFYDDERMLEQEIVKLGGKVFFIEAFNGKNLLRFMKEWKSLLSSHPEYRIVHGHVRSIAAIYLQLAKKMGRVTIAHSHSTSNGNGVKAAVKNIMQYPIRYIVDYMFACSDEAGRWLFGKRAVIKKNYRVIPNAIDTERFAFDGEKRRKIREELGIGDEDFVIGHVGRFIEPKNHSFLVKIFQIVLKKYCKMKLLLVGDGKLMDVIKQETEQLGISDSVIFAGVKRNTEYYYQAMDMFVFPSLHEGLGIVALEAQTAGLPVLCSRHVPPAVKVTDLVQFLDLDDTTEWRDKIIQEINETATITRKDYAGLMRKSEYNIENVAAQMQEFYIKI